MNTLELMADAINAQAEQALIGCGYEGFQRASIEEFVKTFARIFAKSALAAIPITEEAVECVATALREAKCRLSRERRSIRAFAKSEGISVETVELREEARASIVAFLTEIQKEK